MTKTMLRKQVKPTYIVDLRNIEVLEDIPYEFAISKHKAGLYINDEELSIICDEMCKEKYPDTLCLTIVECDCECKKKLPWYKRFWRWITGKN